MIRPSRWEINPGNLESKLSLPSYGVIPLALLYWADWLQHPNRSPCPDLLVNLGEIVVCEPLEEAGKFHLVIVYDNELTGRKEAYDLTIDFSGEPDFDPAKLKEKIRAIIANQPH